MPLREPVLLSLAHRACDACPEPVGGVLNYSLLQGGSEACAVLVPRPTTPAVLPCSSPHLLCGLPDTVTHGLHVALLFLQLLLQLCDPGLQAALLVLERVPKGNTVMSEASSLPWA